MQIVREHDIVRELARRDRALDVFLVSVICAVKRADLYCFIDADPLIRSPGLAVESRARHLTLDGHTRIERPGGEVRPVRGQDAGFLETTKGHATFQDCFAIEVELVSVVIGVSAEDSGDGAHGLHAPDDTVVDERAMGDLRTHIAARIFLERAFIGGEHHFDGGVPVGMAIGPYTRTVHAFDPGIEVTLRRRDVAMIRR